MRTATFEDGRVVQLGGAMNRGADAVVATAAAQVAVHRGGDLVVGRMRRLREQRATPT